MLVGYELSWACIGHGVETLKINAETKEANTKTYRLRIIFFFAGCLSSV